MALLPKRSLKSARTTLAISGYPLVNFWFALIKAKSFCSKEVTSDSAYRKVLEKASTSSASKLTQKVSYLVETTVPFSCTARVRNSEIPTLEIKISHLPKMLPPWNIPN